MPATEVVSTSPGTLSEKRGLQRHGRDHSQLLRRATQLLFLALNIWIGIEFVLFVRFYESGGRTVWVQRPPGVEGWLPIASLMNLRLTLETGHIPRVHPAGMFLLIAFVAMSFLLRKSFCSWLCPIGTVSEALWKAGRRILKRNIVLPGWTDLVLRSLKYIVLGLFLYVVVTMSVAAIREFLGSPYGLIADVKMLNFFRYLSVTAAAVLGLLFLLSIFIQNFWCRYLCPYGALLGLFARFSPARVMREPDACTNCTQCAKACPSLLKVDKLITITSAECTGCLECIAACPAEGALRMSVGRHLTLSTWAMAVGIAILFIGIVAYAQLSGHWQSDIPSQLYFDLIPRAAEFGHP